MSVTEFVKHFGEYFEELFIGHFVGDTVGISRVHLVPIKSIFIMLVVKEAILFVDYLPERLEVAFGGVAGYVLADA